MTDSQLVLSYKSGNSEALLELLSRHERIARIIIARYTSGFEKIDDIYQDCVEKVILKINTLEEESNFLTWYKTILRNASISHGKIGRKGWIKHIQFEESMGLVEIENNLEEDCIKLRQNIKRLSKKQKEVIEYIIDNEGTMVEAAKRLKINYNTVKANYRHGVAALKQIYNKEEDEFRKRFNTKNNK